MVVLGGWAFLMSEVPLYDNLGQRLSNSGRSEEGSYSRLIDFDITQL